jgi:hypothetical protein
MAGLLRTLLLIGGAAVIIVEKAFYLQTVVRRIKDWINANLILPAV